MKQNFSVLLLDYVLQKGKYERVRPDLYEWKIHECDVKPQTNKIVLTTGPVNLRNQSIKILQLRLHWWSFDQ